MAKKNLVYNISSSVGSKGVNAPDDVLLVRFFLRRLSQVPNINGPYKDLPMVTGFDSKLGEAIWWFQKLVRSRGKAIVVDGQVDPAPKGDGLYTIVFMNGNYWKYYPKYRHYIEADPLFPSELVAPFDSSMPVYV